MSTHSSEAPKLYALLIGVDCYLPNSLPDGTYYLNLKGCVRDIDGVEEFLRNAVGLPAERIFKFTSTDDGSPEPPEPPERWPTKANLVAAFQRLGETCRPGDQVYVHYSGHGGRVSTPPRFQKIKGGDGFDEVLVPADIS